MQSTTADPINIDAALAAATQAGETAGRNAADWFYQDTLGGRTTGDRTDVARRLLAGINDGDPEILDALPYADLSGQWADSPTVASVAADALSDAGIDLDGVHEDARGWIEGELVAAYEFAFNSAVEDTVAKDCAGYLAAEED